MKPPYRVVILDDEPPARDLIEAYVNRMPDLTCVGTCSNAMQGLQVIQEAKPDLLFLDIQMPEMTGLELLQLPLMPRPEIILTTAYPQYALTSYEFSVLDYLVKPIAFDRFVKSVVKFRERKQQAPPSPPDLPATGGHSSSVADDLPIYGSDPSSIWLREEKRIVQIPYQDILYVEALKDYVKVYLKDQMILTHMTMGKAEKLFAPPQFMRIHRSYIVHLPAIRLIEGNTITLTTGKQLLMGPNYREDIKRYIPSLS